MRVLMLSLDRGLLGQKGSGDVAERHQKYADLAGSLDVIVFSRLGSAEKIWSDNFRVSPTNSTKLRHFRAAAALAKKLAREKPYDLLVTQDFGALAGIRIKEALKIPWIVNVHSMFFAPHWLGLAFWKWYLFYRMRRAMRKADGFRVNNEIIRKQLQDWGFRQPILVQPTPVDIKKFHLPRQTKIQNPKVLYVGRLSPEKNVAMLIRAFRSVIARSDAGRTEAISLEIVGTGPEEQKLKALAGGDRRIQFLGVKSPDELVGIYQSADIFVLPSNTESFGKVLIEAGAAGCALLATKTPGASGIIENGKTGMLVEICDEQGLKNALEKLILEPNLRAALGEAAQEMSKKYDAEDGIRKTVDFWKEVAKS
jgi:glycosyltransferase involved in cell wall biosynthesis